MDDAHEPKQRYTLEGWADMYVPAFIGSKMHLCQAANEVLRHCRIGMVTRKTTT